jgi:MoaA/NifB/PqqE/SkfB family radical SAM enzyme
MAHKGYLTVDEQGRLELPPGAAARLGLRPGQRLRFRQDGDELRIFSSGGRLARLYVEPTNQCNFDCLTCMRNVWQEPPGRMAPETYQRVLVGIQSFEPLPLVFFGGYGEPLSHPDIFDMVEQAARLGAKTELITNAALLDENAARRLISAGLDRLWVSLDGATPQSYADVRLGDELPRVIANLERLREIAARAGSPALPRLGIAYVALKRNIRDLPEVIRLGQRLGADQFSISNLLAHSSTLLADTLYQHALYPPDLPPTPAAPLVQLPRMEINAETGEALARALEGRLTLAVAGQSLDQGGNTCPFARKGSLSVRWDGAVSPCLPLLHSHSQYLGETPRLVEHFALGHLDKQSLAEIWDSPGCAGLADRLLAFDFSPCVYCNSCEMAEANREDCFGNLAPACGGCLWAQGFIQCP